MIIPRQTRQISEICLPESVVCSVPHRLVVEHGNRDGNGLTWFQLCVRASVSPSAASIAGLPAMVWMVQVKASTSRQSPSARNKPAAVAASCARGGGFETGEPGFGAGLRRKTWTILDYGHRATRPRAERSFAPLVVRVASYCNAAACTMRGRQIRRTCRASGRKP